MDESKDISVLMLANDIHRALLETCGDAIVSGDPSWVVYDRDNHLINGVLLGGEFDLSAIARFLVQSGWTKKQ